MCFGLRKILLPAGLRPINESMSIIKAFLLTLLITLIEAAIQLISFVGFDQAGFSKGFEHLYGITIILCRIIAYATVFYFFWRKKPSNDFQKWHFKPIILLYLILMTFGLRFIGEPFWDFNQIFRNADIALYQFDGVNTKFIYRNISALIIAPVLEELFFRKFLITKLLQKHRKATALIVSALLFSAIHWETVTNLIPAFIFGIIGGMIFLKTRKIGYLILLHFLYNFLGMLVHINTEAYSEVIQQLNFGIFYWVLFVLGIFITLFALQRIPDMRNSITSEKW
jgi:uncharacterized protein